MNSEEDLESIINCLSLLQRIAKYKSKLGLLDINIDYENFIKEILNRVYGYTLERLNTNESNFPGLDLGDKTKRIAYKIFSTITDKNIDHTLKTCLDNLNFMEFSSINIFCLSGKQNAYFIKTETTPHFNFDPTTNIIGFTDLFRDIEILEVQEKRELAKYIERKIPHIAGAEEDAVSVHLGRSERTQTGDDTFCYLMFYNFDINKSIAQNYCIIKSGDSTLYDVSYQIMDINIIEYVLVKSHEELSSVFDFYTTQHSLRENAYYRIYFTARNERWSQDLILRKSEKYQRWLASTIVRNKKGKGIVYSKTDDNFEDEFGPPIWKP